MQNSVIYQKNFSQYIENIKKYKLAIVTANFNKDITHTITEQITKELVNFGMDKNNIKLINVAGALEIPYALKYTSKGYDCLIAVGCVIRGDTYHFEVVCNQSAYGIQKVSLEQNVPIINGILTVNNKQQALERINKSQEFAYTAIEMILLSKGLNHGL